MPFQSEKQRRFLHANHPEIAKRWERDYANGGILDLNESEEIISDDGNDIELTAYNAAFDDPNDLSTGVKSLFQAKDGGRIGLYQGGGPHGGGADSGSKNGKSGNQGGGWSPGVSHSGSPKSSPSSDRGPIDDPDRFGPVSKPQTVPSGINIHGGPTVKEAIRRGELRKMALTYEDQWGKWNDKYDKLNKYSFTGSGVKKRAILTTQNYNEDREALEKKFGKSLIMKIAMAFLGVPISIGYKDIKAVYGMYELEKKFKADMQKLTDISIEKGWAPHHHAVDTPMQTIDQLMLDTIKVGDKDQYEGRDDVVPIHEEIQEYEQMAAQPMSLLGMRDNKALYAALSEKWEKQRREKEQEYKDYGLLPDNPIAMEANSGGLANLFRVKNQ